MRRTRVLASALVVSASAVLTGSALPAGAATTPSVYQPCDAATELYARATDTHNLQVICESLSTPYNGVTQWLPLLDPNPRPTIAGDYPPCSVPGLIANRSSGGIQICEHHFDGLYYFPR